MNFRYDINGLRAIAVIAVVLFHFNPTWVPGGFAGVDVFFVISGFLMTSIIFRGLENNTFNLFKFYIARANRIVPALTFICLFVFIFSFFYQYDVEFNHTLKQITSSLLFFSNFYFWSTANYFSPGSDTNILLHTWSLSAEWQFYIIYPIGLLILSKVVNLNKAKYVIFILCVISFFISYYASPKWVSSSYYLLPTRAWEMLFGGLAYFTKVKPLLKDKQLKFISSIGFGLIIYAYLFFDKSDVWPGSLALIPVFGSYLILISNVGNVVLDNKLSQFLGKISYSLYLWHWPFVYLVNRYFNYAIEAVAIGIVCSIAMSWFSYVWIENKGLNRTAKVLFCFVLLSSFLSTFMVSSLPRGISKTESNDLVNYYDLNNEKIKSKTPWINNVCLNTSDCTQGGVLLWGDSHAEALKFGLSDVFGRKLSVITTASCTPSIKYPDYKLAGRLLCNKNNKMAIKHITNKKPSTVIMATRFRHEKVDWDEITLMLLNLGVKNVVVVGPVPQFAGGLPLLVANKYLYSERVLSTDMDMSIFDTDRIMKEKQDSQYKYISVIGTICEEKKCVFRAVENDNKSLISFDYGHLSDAGSVFIVEEVIIPNLP